MAIRQYWTILGRSQAEDPLPALGRVHDKNSRRGDEARTRYNPIHGPGLPVLLTGLAGRGAAGRGLGAADRPSRCPRRHGSTRRQFVRAGGIGLDAWGRRAPLPETRQPATLGVEKLRQRELHRQVKEMAKLNEQQRARLEVESFENELEVLLSVHKDSSEPIDWKALAFALPPHAPAFSSRNHLRAFVSSTLITRQHENLDQVPRQALSADEAVHRDACIRHEQEYSEWARSKSVAERILAGDTSVFSEVVTEFSSFGEIANLGTTIDQRNQAQLQPLQEQCAREAAKVQADYDQRVLSLEQEAIRIRNEEFFQIQLQHLRDFVGKNELEATFTMTAEAREYRESKALEKMRPEEKAKYRLIEEVNGSEE